MTKSKREFFLERQKEFYHRKAEDKSVRARSYYKLEQIDKKFNLVSDGLFVIDLGSAPGSWLQYLDRNMRSGKIIGIDILPIRNRVEFSEKVLIYEDDFKNILNYISEGDSFDLVLSDMAPEFSGNSKFDRGKTHKLNLSVLEFCKRYLKAGGNAVIKTFEGEDLKFVKDVAKKLFKDVTFFKPRSSQKKSAEVFMICLCKK